MPGWQDALSSEPKDIANCTCASHLTGVQLASGSYQVLPFKTNSHIYMTCSGRTAPFEVDATGSALYFTVRSKIFKLENGRSVESLPPVSPSSVILA